MKILRSLFSLIIVLSCFLFHSYTDAPYDLSDPAVASLVVIKQSIQHAIDQQLAGSSCSYESLKHLQGLLGGLKFACGRGLAQFEEIASAERLVWKLANDFRFSSEDICENLRSIDALIDKLLLQAGKSEFYCSEPTFWDWVLSIIRITTCLRGVEEA